MQPHSASKNHLRIPRFITNPPVTLQDPLNLNRENPAEYVSSSTLPIPLCIEPTTACPVPCRAEDPAHARRQRTPGLEDRGAAAPLHAVDACGEGRDDYGGGRAHEGTRARDGRGCRQHAHQWAGSVPGRRRQRVRAAMVVCICWSKVSARPLGSP